jgi:serine/threonine protein kinase
MSDQPDKKRFPTASEADHEESADSSSAFPEFEGYQIIAELPQGGQAVVYKAIHKATKMKVALKVLLPGLLASEKARLRFEQEVELAASLDHPNIVTIHDSGIAKGQYYFSMAYIHGESLDRYVSLQNLSFRDKMVLFCKICDAITHAHQRGVIHRDLKPSNILIDERGEPHILDFGLAKAAGSLRSVSGGTVMPTVTGQIKGTLAYMSPEQAAGLPHLVDVRTDVYSLGVILYRLLTGRFPYEISGSNLEVLRSVQDAEPVRPRQIISRFDSDVEAIMLKALAKDPGQRYQSTAELRHDLQCWLEGLPIVAKSVSSIYLLRKVISRHRYTSTVVALVLVIVCGFSCTYYHLNTRLRKSNKMLQGTLQSLSIENERYMALAEQVTIASLLDAWHSDRSGAAKLIATYFGEGSREAEASLFLLEKRPLSKKVADFRNKLGPKEAFFAEFIIAEHYLRDGNRAEAEKVYRKCLSISPDARKDEWLNIRIKVRLRELTGEHSRPRLQ